ncbi:MAG: hypothetical protein M0Z51_11185 [Propionibacterium sp.]|nr:hypothetical protein [Propionibacterium sp.]
MSPRSARSAAWRRWCCSTPGHTPRAGLTRLYGGLVLIVAVAVLMQLLHDPVPGFPWTLLATEALLVGAFAVFWLAQTLELWDAGVRPASGAVTLGRVPAAGRRRR